MDTLTIQVCTKYNRQGRTRGTPLLKVSVVSMDSLTIQGCTHQGRARGPMSKYQQN